MDRDSVNRLRFDRRLEQRLGWAENSDRESHLESLPDVSEKMTRGLEEAEAADEGAAEAPRDLATGSGTPASTPAPPASGGFNPPGGFSSGGGTELS